MNYAAGSADNRSPGGCIVDYDWYGELIAVPGDYSTVTGGLLIEMGDPKSGKSVWAASYVMRGNNPQSLQVMVATPKRPCGERSRNSRRADEGPLRRALTARPPRRA